MGVYLLLVKSKLAKQCGHRFVSLKESSQSWLLKKNSCLSDTCCNIPCLHVHSVGCGMWNRWNQWTLTVTMTADVTFHVCMFTVYGVEQAEPVNSDCHNIWCNIPCLYVHSVSCGTWNRWNQWTLTLTMTSDVTFHVCMFTVYHVEQMEPVNIDSHSDIWCNIWYLHVHSVSCGTWSRQNQWTSLTVTRTQSSPSHGTARAVSLPLPPKTRSCAPSIPEPAEWRQ